MVMTSNGGTRQGYRYVAYEIPGESSSHVGHLDEEQQLIYPLAYTSGTAIHSLYEVLVIGSKNIIQIERPIAISSVSILPTISGRDILAVGKNYAEHAVEFNASGYDSSDKADQPTHPVIFTKRASSIVGHDTEIFPHPDFTDSLDYEGEIGVIVGKTGFQIPHENAMDHVWGFTIINDITAREKQRDHKQFFLGKSADTFCPIGPVAMAKEDLPKVLEVKTLVNGEQRQISTTDKLIFDVPTLISTCSLGQTLQVGDTIATGTPAGVGFGFDPPKWLRPGDTVEVQVTGLGSLKNRVGQLRSENPTVSRLENVSYIPTSNEKSSGAAGLENIGGKKLFYKHHGTRTGKPVLFIHGLGATSQFFMPVVQRLEESHSLHLCDLEGHGLSPTSALSELTIESFTKDAEAVCSHAQIRSKLIVVAHSMGCLIGLNLALQRPDLVDQLVLLGPPPSHLPQAAAQDLIQRASTVRKGGMMAVASAIATAGTSHHSQKTNPLSFAATKISLLSQDPEGYAKACTALAGSSQLHLAIEDIKSKVLIITGSEDQVSPPSACEVLKRRLSNLDSIVVLDQVGHWHLFEDTAATVDAIERFIK